MGGLKKDVLGEKKSENQLARGGGGCLLGTQEQVTPNFALK